MRRRLRSEKRKRCGRTCDCSDHTTNHAKVTKTTRPVNPRAKKPTRRKTSREEPRPNQFPTIVPSLATLPEELVEFIYDHVSPRDVLSLRLVCRRLAHSVPWKNWITPTRSPLSHKLRCREDSGPSALMRTYATQLSERHSRCIDVDTSLSAVPTRAPLRTFNNRNYLKLKAFPSSPVDLNCQLRISKAGVYSVSWKFSTDVRSPNWIQEISIQIRQDPPQFLETVSESSAKFRLGSWYYSEKETIAGLKLKGHMNPPSLRNPPRNPSKSLDDLSNTPAVKFSMQDVPSVVSIQFFARTQGAIVFHMKKLQLKYHPFQSLD